MSFLNKINVPLINSKITALGRQKIAEGNLNFKYYSFGDSQVDYNNTGSQYVLKPKDKNPNIKTHLTTEDCNPFHLLDGVKVLECCIHNPAKERGFFDETKGYSLKMDSKFVKKQGNVFSQQLNGTKFIDLQNTDFEDGDIIMFKIANATTGYIVPSSSTEPILYLFFKIYKTPTSTIIELDRNLPYLNYNDILIEYFIYDKDIEYYKSTNVNTLWDYENLNFKLECLNEDTYVWNFNIIWGENVIGTQADQQQFNEYCSYNYIGQKEYLGFNVDCPDEVPNPNCEDKLFAIDDDFIKSIGIIHYSNTNKTNLYGEHFYIAEPNDFKLQLQHVMWHRRYASGGTGTGTVLGMTFVADTTKKYVGSGNTNIEYYDLVEDSTLIEPSGSPLVVGRIYNTLQTVVIHNPDLLAALSYKSNRNFTLPKLAGKMISPSTSGQGILPKGKTMYMTYTLEADTVVQHILPQQQYLKFVNTTNSNKDVEFFLERTGFLPYMRQREAVGYDGLGFSFHRFKILYQIVDNGARPVSSDWKAIDFTNNFLVDLIGNTINPLKLEVQNSAQTGFIVNAARIATETPYNLNVLNVPDVNCPNVMGFGCEYFLYGNIAVEIGACVYKSIFELVLDSDYINRSDNPTWNTNQNLKLTEIGIYDDKYNLVMINSLYEQIEIQENTKSLIEIQMDF